MGNTYTLPFSAPVKAADAPAMFHALDVEGKEYLTIKDLMAATSAGLMMPHSLPALYFFDDEKNGTLALTEFVSLVHFCHSEKRKVEEALCHDKQLRDLILRASKAGVKDCSMHDRSSFRRLSSYTNVRSVFSSRHQLKTLVVPQTSHGASSSTPVLPVSTQCPSPRCAEDPVISQSPSDSSDSVMSHNAVRPTYPIPNEFHHASESPVSSDHDVSRTSVDFEAPQMATISMYSVQNEFDASPDASESTCDPDCKDPNNRTALDAAVLENIMHANIHKLADLLHTEGSREQFMSWLWNLANFNRSGVVTLEELRVFLAALSDDGIDLAELVFYKEVGVPLEECIINEFDSTHSGLLSRDEFMVLADLVTREYEFWENRHLERIGDYELGRTIGRGSSGVVRFAVHVETRQKVAIKIIKKGNCSDLSRLDREIQSLMAAKHKNIVGLEEVLDSKNNIFIVMELCGGGTLVDIVRLYPEERMPEETARFFIRQFFEALAFCHRNGICHRDVRLDNLMLDNDGIVKITDFGHSGIYAPGWDLFSTSLVGSVYNLSPEQVLGSLYSGEKIDVWSAGVAVYCLLVGRPPFFEPEVTPLLERITACNFETPSFLSQKASDFINCMIRAAPDDRISVQQMLHHPWFYDGPENRPSMNVVVIPVDAFFKTRPDIAEMIMAITIYQHNLHFHIGDSQSPRSSPEDHRGQEWTLKCLCPKNDIKFTISLFTRAPSVMKKTASQLPATASFSALPVSPKERSRALCKAEVVHDLGTRFHRKMASEAPSVSQLIEISTCSKIEANESDDRLPCLMVQGSASRPPLRRRRMKITPLTVAAHIRDAAAHGSIESFIYSALLDLESDGGSGESPAVPRPSAKLLKVNTEEKGSIRSNGRKRRRGKHVRSHSLDDKSFMRVSRSATVDAFPYQKVYPKREMPESARNLNFETPDASATRSDFDIDNCKEGENSTEQGSSQLHRFHRSVTLQAVSSYNADLGTISSALGGLRDNDIAQKLSRHPSKTVSPQSPQVQRFPQGVSAETLDGLSSISAPVVRCSTEIGEMIEEKNNEGDSEKEGLDKAFSEESDEVQPFLEVRLLDGESGVFLKICRKLKTICTTKLAAAANRENLKNTGSGGSSSFRRSDSERSIHSDVTEEESGLRNGVVDSRTTLEGT